MKKYFYSLLAKYIGFYTLSSQNIKEINPKNNHLLKTFNLSLQKNSGTLEDVTSQDEWIVLNGTLHYERDIQDFLQKLNEKMSLEARAIICYYSALWSPLARLASAINIRSKTVELNWISPSDVKNFALLSNFDIVSETQKVLMPLYIPLLSSLINKWLAPLPIFRWFALVNMVVVRKNALLNTGSSHIPSVSVVVPARNEEGNIENIVKRFPKMGPADELIFIEGNSTDNTWREIQRVQMLYDNQISIKIGQQPGKGKADAVRKGFDMATKDILMILDADITVEPEELVKFYRAIADNRGEFINGSRLVYQMEQEAMRFFNILGNRFFALAFSFVLNQPLKDTLCGTKVMTKKNYERLSANRKYFGDFDPFGDFDLLFGAAKLGLKIVELPIHYKARTYGDTNISRWKHGVILLRMLVFAARRIKFI